METQMRIIEENKSENNKETQTSGLLPDDNTLLSRKNVWMRLFEKYKKTRPEDTEKELEISFAPEDISELSEDEYNENFSEEECESVSLDDNEGDPDFDVKKVLEETLLEVRKRKEKWHNSGIEEEFNTFSSTISPDAKVIKWLENNCPNGTSVLSEDLNIPHLQSVKIDKPEKYFRRNEYDDSELSSVDTAKYILTNKKKVKNRTNGMIIKEYCYSKKPKHDRVRDFFSNNVYNSEHGGWKSLYKNPSIHCCNQITSSRKRRNSERHYIDNILLSRGCCSPRLPCRDLKLHSHSSYYTHKRGIEDHQCSFYRNHSNAEDNPITDTSSTSIPSSNDRDIVYYSEEVCNLPRKNLRRKRKRLAYRRLPYSKRRQSYENNKTSGVSSDDESIRVLKQGTSPFPFKPRRQAVADARSINSTLENSAFYSENLFHSTEIGFPIKRQQNEVASKELVIEINETSEEDILDKTMQISIDIKTI